MPDPMAERSTPRLRGFLRRGTPVVTLVLWLAAVPAVAQQVTLALPLERLIALAARDSTDPLVLYDLGVGYWVSGDFVQAEAALRRADAIDPRVPEVQLALAYLPYARRPKLWQEETKGKVPQALIPTVDEANRRFRRAYMLDPMVDMRIVGLVIPPRDAIIIGKNADRYFAALVLGLEYFWGGDYVSAYGSLEEAYSFTTVKDRDQIPSGVLWYHGLAAAHIGEYPVAIADFRLLLARAVEREKSDSVTRFAVLPSNNIRYVLATILRRAGQLDAAREEFQSVLTTDLSFEMAHAQLAEIAEKSRQWSAAVTERERALEANPEDSGLLLDYGATLLRAQRYGEASVALAQAEKAMPLNARVPYLMGQAAMADGRTEEGMQAFRRFVAIAPSRFEPQVRQLEARYGSLATPAP